MLKREGFAFQKNSAVFVPNHGADSASGLLQLDSPINRSLSLDPPSALSGVKFIAAKLERGGNCGGCGVVNHVADKE